MVPKVYSAREFWCEKGQINCFEDTPDCVCYHDERYDYCTYREAGQGCTIRVRVEVPAPKIVDFYDPNGVEETV